MMHESNPPSPFDQVRALADAQFDGTINRDQVEQLEQLILSDSPYLQAYVERMTFHGHLLKDSDQRTPAQAAMGVLREFSHAIALHERRWRRAFIWIPAVLGASLLLAVTFWMFPGRVMQSPPLGVISSLSADARIRSQEFDLGSVVRIGETFVVTEGIVSLQLPTALVDFIGPTTVKLESAGMITLTSGTVLTKMLKEGGRLTIMTPDAEVVDLGTEFLVQHDAESGTNVSVRQGRVQATLLDWRNSPKKSLDLTEQRSAVFKKKANTATEVDFRPQLFLPVDQSRGDIQRIEGMLRTGTREIANLQSEESLTHNHALVIPERQNVVLEQDLTVQDLSGPSRIPAGSMVSSYLVHYDPPQDVTRAPRGAATFFSPIAAVVTRTNDLKATDSLLGIEGTRFEQADFRGMERGLNEDGIQISNDRKTVSFRFDTSPPRHLDEARIIVIVSKP